MGYKNKTLNETKFSTEDMIEFGKNESKKNDLNEDLIKFHKFTVEMLEYELGLSNMAEYMIGKKKTFYNAVKAGTKVTGFAATTMNRYAKTTAQELKLKKKWALRKLLNTYMKAYDKYSMERFYYKTGKRYLRVVGFRC